MLYYNVYSTQTILIGFSFTLAIVVSMPLKYDMGNDEVNTAGD